MNYINIASIFIFLPISIHLLIKFAYYQTVGNTSRFTLNITGSIITFERNEDGVMKIIAENWDGFNKGLGYVHAKDRCIQMYLTSVTANGKLSELIVSDNNSLKIDKFMRHMGFYYYANLSDYSKYPQLKTNLDSYSDGINYFLFEENNILPLEFHLINFKPYIWNAAYSLAIFRLMLYLGLSDTQQHVEKFIIQSLRFNNQSSEFIKKLFYPHLNSFDNKIIDILKKVHVDFPILPKEYSEFLPKMTASNNWAVSPKKSESGFSIYASDPHLNVVQLPPIWYEVIGHIKNSKNQFITGITVPGIPGIAMGRTESTAWGFTYGFMDTIDYFIEYCKDHHCKINDNTFEKISKRTEIIKRKDQKNPIEMYVYETSHGTLEYNSDNDDKIKEGYYLSRASADLYEGGLKTFNIIHLMSEAETVEEFQKIAKDIEIPANFIIVDKKNIGYQQSGNLPKRIHSGLYPLIGWDSNNNWKGLVNKDDLTSILNPESGILVTANDYWNTEGKPLAVNTHMGPYRSDRIKKLLNSKEKNNIEDFKRIQSDLYSIQAEKYMEILKPLLPKNNSISEILKKWDLKYDKSSKGAVIFEEFYLNLLEEVFGRIYGKSWNSVIKPIITPFFFFFDKVILEYSSEYNAILWKNETREELFLKIIKKILINKTEYDIPTWGEKRMVYMENILFAGKFSWLTNFLGINYGPFPLEGGRSTVHQTAYWKDNTRSNSVGPSWRFITDMGNKFSESILPGGISDNLFSNLYITNEIQKWINFEYKKIHLY
jgi:penicillin amidase